MNGRYNNPPVNGVYTQAGVTYSAGAPANNTHYVNQPDTCCPPNTSTGYQSNPGSVHTTFSIFAPPNHNHGHHHDHHHHHGHHHEHDHHHDYHHSDCSLS